MGYKSAIEMWVSGRDGLLDSDYWASCATHPDRREALGLCHDGGVTDDDDGDDDDALIPSIIPR